MSATSASRTAQGRRAVLRARPPPRRSRSGAPLSARADRPGVEPEDQSRKGLRPDPAPRPGGGGLPRDGRAPRDQDAAAPMSGGPTMSAWSKDELRRTAKADDLNI